MGASRLSSRAIIGTYYKTLEQDVGSKWVGAISNYFNSNQPTEEYPWLGQSPVMREWVGSRQAKGFRENGLTIRNKLFEATLEVQIDELRRDKTGQIMVRVREMAVRTNTHWASLLAALIIAGESTVCYDGQYFFDTDHSEGDSGAQSNDISIDISALPTSVHGASASAPSVEEFQLAVTDAIGAMLKIVDDQGEPMNENARSFLVAVPTSLWSTAGRALYVPPDQGMAGSQTTLAAPRQQGFTIDYFTTPRLNSWTTKFAVFRTDSEIKPLIRQEETGVEMKAIAEGSELEFTQRQHWYGVETWRNVAYGMWQHALLATMT